jgi:hypothetical protein
MGCSGCEELFEDKFALSYQFNSKIRNSGFYYKFDKKQLKEIELEDKILSQKLKIKIEELKKKMNEAEPHIIAEGDYCSNPCYEYNKNIIEHCPKCGGRAIANIENERKDPLIYGFNQNSNYLVGCCEKFTYKDIDKIDFDLDSFFDYFTKYDEIKKRYYMIVDGERFDAPVYLTVKDFFMINDTFFFGGKTTDLCFFYENKHPELGQSLGNYGYAFLHYIYLYDCKKCGHQYHILRTSPFKFRDKTKDNIIIEKPQEEINNEKNEKEVKN